MLDWLDRALTADLVVTSGGPVSASGQTVPMKEEVGRDIVEQLPGARGAHQLALPEVDGRRPRRRGGDRGPRRRHLLRGQPRTAPRPAAAADSSAGWPRSPAARSSRRTSRRSTTSRSATSSPFRGSMPRCGCWSSAPSRTAPTRTGCCWCIAATTPANSNTKLVDIFDVYLPAGTEPVGDRTGADVAGPVAVGRGAFAGAADGGGSAAEHPWT